MNHNTSTQFQPVLDFGYTAAGADYIFEAFKFVGLEAQVSSKGFIEVDLRDGRVIRVTQDDNVFEVILFDHYPASGGRAVAGKMRLQGALASVAMIAAVVVEIAA